MIIHARGCIRRRMHSLESEMRKRRRCRPRATKGSILAQERAVISSNESGSPYERGFDAAMETGDVV